MEFLTDSFMSAFLLLWGLDQELLQIVYVSLKVSSISTLIASMIGIPAGFLIAFRDFNGKRLLITVLNTLLALPTVVVGLFVYAFISRRGIFGLWDLLYTQKAIIIGQVILIIPINPKMYPHVKFDWADTLAKWLVSPKAQALIAEYRIQGQQAFFPDAIKYAK